MMSHQFQLRITLWEKYVIIIKLLLDLLLDTRY